MRMWFVRWRMLLSDLPATIEGAVRFWCIRMAVSAGRRAALAGRDQSANPYREGSLHLRAAWLRGYRQGVVELGGRPTL